MPKQDDKFAKRVERVIRKLKKEGIIDFLGKGKEYPLDCLDLKGVSRFKADWAFILNGKAVFLEVDNNEEGQFDHNVIKYFPYFDKGPEEVKNGNVELFHLIGQSPKVSENNYSASIKLAEYCGRLIESAHKKTHPENPEQFKYKKAEIPISTSDDGIEKIIKGIA